jgi:hypothetical protein
MDLPAFRRGLELVSADLNKLSNAVRAASVTSVIGGTFNRTPGGTTIIVNDQVRGGSAGGSASLPCPFKVFDASDSDGMKVQVTWGLIYQMLPTGMFPNNNPRLKLTVTETSYVYSKIVFNTNTLLPTEVLFSVETEIKENTSTTQYNLMAVVYVDSESDPAVISYVQNMCQQPYPNPCSLAPED